MQGQFREDLYHRLDLLRIQLVPLRERGEDVLRLAEMLLRQLCKRYRVPPRRISPTGRSRMLSYAWPGNVRELAHELERALVFSEETLLDFEHLPATGQEHAASTGPASPGTDWFNEEFQFPAEGFSLEAAINRVIHHALKQTRNNVSAAARLLGVSRDYVRYRLRGQEDEPQ
jgi:DNA-binding NtrC family response regulator